MVKKIFQGKKKLLNLKICLFFQKKWKLLAILSLLTIFILAWRLKVVADQQPKLTFAHPEYRNISKTIEVSGIIDAKEKANLRFAAGGKVTFLGAKESDIVKKWQTIAIIDQRDLQKRLKEDLNNYLKERWDFETTQDRYDYPVENLTTRRTLDQDQWDLENKVLDVEIRDIAITNTVLTAPFAGILVGVPTSVPNVNLLATDIFELINPNSLIFKAAVDETDISQIKIGQTGQIYLDAFPTTPVQTQVSFIAYKSSQTSTGTAFVIELPITGENLLDRYKLGMNGDVKVVIDTKDNVLTIAYTATRQRDGKNYVDVKNPNNDQYQEKEVTLGLESEEYVEIIDGLTTNDLVLVPEN